jgi:hypothetical protein
MWLGSGSSAAQELAKLPAEVLEKCRRGAADGEHCPCLAECWSKRKQGCPPQTTLASYMLSLHSIRFACESAMAAMQLLLPQLANLMEQSMDSWTTDDPGKVGMAILPGNTGKKRRLVDSDFREYACVKVLKDGKAYSSGAWAKAHGQASGSTAATWDESYMAEYQAACWLSASGCCTFSLAPDAARFGSPAQETLLIPCWMSTKTLGCWLPPQALRFSAVCCLGGFSFEVCRKTHSHQYAPELKPPKPSEPKSHPPGLSRFRYLGYGPQKF